MKKRLYGWGRPVQFFPKAGRFAPYGIRLAYALPGAGAVPRLECNWRTASGMYVNTPWGQLFIFFRNWRVGTGYATRPYRVRRDAA